MQTTSILKQYKKVNANQVSIEIGNWNNAIWCPLFTLWRIC